MTGPRARVELILTGRTPDPGLAAPCEHSLAIRASIPCDIAIERGRVETDRPGREVSKEHREVIVDLIDNQGWAYKLPSGGGYPMLYPADRTHDRIRVPKTGHSGGNAFGNWIAEIRRKGGHWPPDRV
jgi:hypothetical protein